jgi:hypothetical protein
MRQHSCFAAHYSKHSEEAKDEAQRSVANGVLRDSSLAVFWPGQKALLKRISMNAALAYRLGTGNNNAFWLDPQDREGRAGNTSGQALRRDVLAGMKSNADIGPDRLEIVLDLRHCRHHGSAPPMKQVVCGQK